MTSNPCFSIAMTSDNKHITHKIGASEISEKKDIVEKSEASDSSERSQKETMKMVQTELDMEDFHRLSRLAMTEGMNIEELVAKKIREFLN